MTESMTLQGRRLSGEDIEFIRKLIADNPTWSRWRLSIKLCEAWNWRNAKGDIKDMASRTLLVKLDGRGFIQLPARRRPPPVRMAKQHSRRFRHDTTPVETLLAALRPLKVIKIDPRHAYEELFGCLLSSYHYLGYTSTVGENMKYLVQDNQGRSLACLVFGSSAWSAVGRDCFIGWDKDTRQRNINLTTNNTRYLILPWVQVKCLASHILGLVSRQIKQDWEERYGHPVYLLETFVEQNRFKGICYKASNWQQVGQTQGRSRNDRYSTLKVPIKSIFVYPLTDDFRQRLQA